MPGQIALCGSELPRANGVVPQELQLIQHQAKAWDRLGSSCKRLTLPTPESLVAIELTRCAIGEAMLRAQSPVKSIRGRPAENLVGHRQWEVIGAASRNAETANTDFRLHGV